MEALQPLIHVATDGFRRFPTEGPPIASIPGEGGYSHHITRLMVLANLATLLGVSPRDLTDWFWVAYTDAYGWMVEPNVLGFSIRVQGHNNRWKVSVRTKGG
jgi:hypothetical protein